MVGHFGLWSQTPRSLVHHHPIMRDSWVKNCAKGTSLVVQWLRICLPMQETRVRSLVWEDPTCHRATKPVCHNY